MNILPIVLELLVALNPPDIIADVVEIFVETKSEILEEVTVNVLVEIFVKVALDASTFDKVTLVNDVFEAEMF